MSTHDVLSYAIASAAVSQIRMAAHPWSAVLSVETHVSTSRDWPVPDAVLRDDGNRLSVAMEFKPPAQTKREYLTGLGQSIAYTRDFDYALIVLPNIADDGYPIAEHVAEVLRLPEMAHVPVGLLAYDARTITPVTPNFEILHWFAGTRGAPPPNQRDVAATFYAKWREVTPSEVARYLALLFDATLRPAGPNPKHQAFQAFWAKLQAGAFRHWSGGPRTASNSASNQRAWQKNVFNFVRHLLWIEADGRLTSSGFAALRVATSYGGDSRVFLDVLSRAVLEEGKHLVLINAIDEFQQSRIERDKFPDSPTWVAEVENSIEARGFVQRNFGKAAAAVKGKPRNFFKAENQLWYRLGFVKRRGKYSYHPGRGYVFDWSRITDLLKS